MLRILFFPVFFLPFLAGASSFSPLGKFPETDILVSDTNRQAKDENIEALEDLEASLKGVTDKGNPYNLYAFKVRKEWNFIILDSLGYYSVKQHKKTEEIKENSGSHTELLCLMIKADMVKKVSKPKNVSGLTFSCYYKLKFKAKKLYKSLNSLYEEAQVVSEAVKGRPKGIWKLF